MKINFDNLRIKGSKAYNSLVKELNNHIEGETMGAGRFRTYGFHTGDIRDQLNDLHDFLGAILSLESDDGEIKPIENIDLLVFDEEGA